MEYLVGKRALNHLAKLAKWFSCVVSSLQWLCVFIMSHTQFNPIITWITKNSLFERGAISKIYVTTTGLESQPRTI